MFAALALGAALAITPPASAQDQPSPQTQADAPVRLEDVVTNARRLEDATTDLVGEIAAPVRRRGFARWHDGVCVGVGNLDTAIAQQITDRVSDVARELGLKAGEPGCNPSILIVATTDANAFTADFVAMRPRLFRVGGSGMDRGSAAFEDFIKTERPVRWWSVSQPTDADSGARAVRLPGEVHGAATGAGSALAYAPQIAVRGPSRLVSQYRQDLKRTFVVIDVDRLNGVNLGQLSDYIAMVSLAQIDPDANTARFETILNVFNEPVGAEGLTGWDMAYLRGLYDTAWYRINARSQVASITRAVEQRYRDGLSDETGE